MTVASKFHEPSSVAIQNGFVQHTSSSNAKVPALDLVSRPLVAFEAFDVMHQFPYFRPFAVALSSKLVHVITRYVVQDNANANQLDLFY